MTTLGLHLGCGGCRHPSRCLAARTPGRSSCHQSWAGGESGYVRHQPMQLGDALLTKVLRFLCLSRWGKLRKRNRSEYFILLAYSHQHYRPGGDIWFLLRDGEGWQSFAAAQRFQVSMATFARWKEIRCEGKVWLKIDPNVIMTELNQELHDHHHDSWPLAIITLHMLLMHMLSLTLMLIISACINIIKNNIKTFKLSIECELQNGKTVTAACYVKEHAINEAESLSSLSMSP